MGTLLLIVSPDTFGAPEKIDSDPAIVCSYNMIKRRMQGGDPNYRTTSSQHLLAAAEASEIQLS